MTPWSGSWPTKVGGSRSKNRGGARRRSERLEPDPRRHRQTAAGRHADRRAGAVERGRPLEALVVEADQRAGEQRQRFSRSEVERRLDLSVELRGQVGRGRTAAGQCRRLAAGIEGARHPHADRHLIDSQPSVAARCVGCRSIPPPNEARQRVGLWPAPPRPRRRSGSCARRARCGQQRDRQRQAQTQPPGPATHRRPARMARK